MSRFIPDSKATDWTQKKDIYIYILSEMIHLQLASFAICDPVQSPWILLETSLPITADLCQDTDFTERLYNSTMLAVGHSEVKWLRNLFEEGKFLV